MELFRLTIHELQALLRAGTVSATDVVSDTYRRIDAVEGSVHA